MKRALFIVCSFCILASACTQRSICPAFQSAYIYDKDALRKKFSYFQEDSTPKVLTASKNKYLIAEAVPYRRKIARISTVEMKDVMPVVPDSLTMDDDISLADLDAAARSVIDSTYIVDVEPQTDSLADEELEYMISKDKEVRVLRYDKDSISYKVDEVRFNIDQDNYMWYLRDAIVLPDIRLLQIQGQAAEEEALSKKEKKGISAFFKNLFKKKKKDEELVDSTDLEPPVERSQYDLDYVEDENPKPAPTETKKRGLFKRKAKKEEANGTEEGKVSTGRQRPPKQKKEKKPKQEKADKINTEDEKPPDSEVKGEEGF